VKLEIEDKELIEFVVTLKERLDRLERKLDTAMECLLEEPVEPEENPWEVSGAPYAAVATTEDKGKLQLDKEELETIVYEAMPTYERLNLYNAIPMLDGNIEGIVKWTR
jgi:hypothetical protein